MHASSAPVLQFAPLGIRPEPPFWSAFGERKLEDWKLWEDAGVVHASYRAGNPQQRASQQLALDHKAFESADGGEPTSSVAGVVDVLCSLKALNSVDRVNGLDRAEAMREAARQVWTALQDGSAEQKPSLLVQGLLVAHADLKSFVYTYRFACPALKPATPFTSTPPRPVSDYGTADTRRSMMQVCNDWIMTHRDQAAFFLLSCGSGGACAAHPISTWAELAPPAPASASSFTRRAGPNGEQQAEPSGSNDTTVLAMIDPSAYPVPGWPLRNALLLAATRWSWTRIHALCLREAATGVLDERASLLVPDIDLQQAAEGGGAGGTCPAAVGWQLDAAGKPGPERVELGEALDPHRQAAAAVDLNLKLMRWRAVPELDLDRIRSASCLLLGAGTLGCEVARTLLAWGVRRVAFLDNGRVSFSNPVRQSLYGFDDCLQGGAPKAEAAAEQLRRIFPGVDARGVAANIPMPGHPPPLAELQEAEEDFRILERLVEEADVVFVLTDTRESRWLPTVLCLAHDTPCINAALGFDSFLVMRHGAASAPASAAAPRPPRLGCYFCTDVVAPINSTLDRAMDQFCTVARPGLCRIAGGLAVELAVAVLTHPLGAAAPAQEAEEGQAGGALGPCPPHQIRGQLYNFSQTAMVGHSFPQCTACGSAVLQQLRRGGWEWVLRVLAQPALLEELTGLQQLVEQLQDLCSDNTSGDAGGEDGGGEDKAEDDWLAL